MSGSFRRRRPTAPVPKDRSIIREAMEIARERHERWQAEALCLVSHPTYGQIIVPGDCELSAWLCAMDVWECSFKEVIDAGVTPAPPDAVSVPLPRIVLLYKGMVKNAK